MFDMTRPQRAVSSPSIEPGPLSKPQSHDCSMSEHRQISETTSVLATARSAYCALEDGTEASKAVDEETTSKCREGHEMSLL